MLKAIKLYSTSPPLDRDALVRSIFKSMKDAFGAVPDEFDIHGPYGIKKGSIVGFKAFQDKLARNGHADYYALSGNTPGNFGFNLLLDARIGETSYNELIVWFASEKYEVDFLCLVEPILARFNTSCGFEIEIPSDHLVTTETKIRKSVFGTTSVEVNNKHLAWIPSISKGMCRGPFKNNIYNDDQLKYVLARTDVECTSIGNGLHFVHQSRAKDYA